MKKNANIIPMITIGIMYKSIFTGGGSSKPGGGGGAGLARMVLLQNKTNSSII
jgi:hypothetical protein